jgi:hypothetical protein
LKKTEKPLIRISLTTRLDTASWEFGRQVLELLCEADARLLPEKVNNFEPIKIPVTSVEECEKYWSPEAKLTGPGGGALFFKMDFLWRRSRAIKSSGHVLHTSHNRFGKLKFGWVTFQATPDKKTNWHRLFHRLCTLAQPNFGTLHLCTHAETQPGAFGAESDANYGTNDFLLGTAGIALEQRGLANLAWATFFGQEFAAEVDPEKLRAHGFGVEAIGDGFLVTVTPSLFDVANNFVQFSSRRAELKNLFRLGLFRIQNEPPG